MSTHFKLDTLADRGSQIESLDQDELRLIAIQLTTEMQPIKMALINEHYSLGSLVANKFGCLGQTNQKFSHIF